MIEYTRSPKQDKRRRIIFMMGSKKHTIDFGANKPETVIDHGDDERRLRYRARARGITNKQGEHTYLNPLSANFWSYNVLWGETTSEEINLMKTTNYLIKQG